MRHRKRSAAPGCVLLIILVAAVTAAAWFGVPALAQRNFGESAEYLKGFPRWNFSAQTLLHRDDLVTSVSSIGGEIDFSIESAESISSISRRLEQAGLINDAAGFRAYLVYKGYDSQIKAGRFKLFTNQNSLEIAESIQAAYSPIVSFYIYPGWRAEEVSAALPTSGIEVDPAEFLQIVYDAERLEGLTIFAELESLEGFLFPGTYEIDRKISPEELVMIFIDRFNENVPPEVIDAINARGLSLYEGITLASIIQRETFMDDERGLMASVFYNRLQAGMKLETDPTVQYALGYSEKWGNWWKTPLKTTDLRIESPYNTYHIYGLPPTPISNPGLPSILAVAYPDDSPFFYFRATCDNSGYHDFSVTFEEHISKECK